MENVFNTPILFLIFNRPELTKKVFEQIKTIKPKFLFIAADGPRDSIKGENEKCDQTRSIVNEINWDCNLQTLFREKNLGCKNAVAGGITWFFENVESGIILEDDCFPDITFFRFCSELLEKYKDDKSIVHIGGTNPVDESLQTNTYYFSKYNRIWGWATWRRAWKYFDPDIEFWGELKKKNFHKKNFPFIESIIWRKNWDNVYNHKLDTWDYQWYLCRLINGKAIAPNTNLVTNIGFNKDATHTKDSKSILSNLPLGKMNFPLVHPVGKNENKHLDEQWSKKLSVNFIKDQIKYFIKRFTK